MSSEETDNRVFKAMAAPIRRELMDALRDNPQTTGELCARFGHLNRCTVMQHLGVLEEAGLVIARRQGRQRWNYLNAIPIRRIHDRWIGDYAAAAAGILDRLESDMSMETERAG